MSRILTKEEIEKLFISAVKHYLVHPEEKANQLYELFSQLSPYIEENSFFVLKEEIEKAFNEYEMLTMNLVGHHVYGVPVFGTEHNRKNWQEMLSTIYNILEKREVNIEEL
jgi:hypothetical protein